MDLRELDAVAVGFGARVQDNIFLESDFIAFSDLGVPGETIAMRIDAGDDVVEAVAVYVIDEHLRATHAGTEAERMMFPHWIAGQGLGLLPPTVLVENIHTAIAIDIARADPM